MKLLNEYEINLVTGAWCICLTTGDYNSLKPSGKAAVSSNLVSCAATCCMGDFHYYIFTKKAKVEYKETWHSCDSPYAIDACANSFLATVKKWSLDLV